MYETLEINNFRGIKNFKMGDFRQINLLVGKNNCGKTTILESLFLITGPTNPQLPIRINAFRNITLIDETYWSLIFNNLNINSEIKISAQVEANFEKENRTLCIKPSNKSRVSQAKSRDDKAIEGIEATNSSSGTMPLINGLTLSFTLARDDSDQMNIVSEIFQGMAPDGRFLNFEFNKDFKDSLSGVFINQTTTSSDELGVRFSKVQISKQVEKLVEVLNKLDQSIKSLALSSNRLIYCDIGLDSLLPMYVFSSPSQISHIYHKMHIL
jgi:ABC-type sugar transport system ATPase subunit